MICEKLVESVRWKSRLFAMSKECRRPAWSVLKILAMKFELHFSHLDFTTSD